MPGTILTWEYVIRHLTLLQQSQFHKNRQNCSAAHCVKYRNFTQFPGMKLCLSAKFPHKKLHEITAFYAVVL